MSTQSPQGTSQWVLRTMSSTAIWQLTVYLCVANSWNIFFVCDDSTFLPAPGDFAKKWTCKNQFSCVICVELQQPPAEINWNFGDAVGRTEQLSTCKCSQVQSLKRAEKMTQLVARITLLPHSRDQFSSLGWLCALSMHFYAVRNEDADSSGDETSWHLSGNKHEFSNSNKGIFWNCRKAVLVLERKLSTLSTHRCNRAAVSRSRPFMVE